MTSPSPGDEQLWRSAVINVVRGAIQGRGQRGEAGVMHRESQIQKRLQRSNRNPESIGRTSSQFQGHMGRTESDKEQAEW